MAVECAFGILKGRWRMLMNRINVPLQIILDIVTTCLCLHNLCIIHGEEFDLNWAKSAKENMKKTSSKSFSDLRNAIYFMS
jgi:hypothetical protein